MNHRVAAGVAEFELADYQRAVRTVLRHPLISERYPDQKALPLVRRWASELRTDLAESFGYRLELSSTAARLVRVIDHLDPTLPTYTRSGREFDRQRYAYLALVLAALGRAGVQVALSELADRVAADASRTPGLRLDTARGQDRAAFVDVVGWLEDRGSLRLADGSARAWADDPERAEALYDIDRDTTLAIYRPTRVLHHIDTVTALLSRPVASSRDSARRAAGQRARRAVVEQAVVYYDDVEPEVRNILRNPALTADLARLTGLAVERRAEGLALIDTAGLAERRFPSGGSIAHAALLLLGEIADRIVDPDAPPLRRLPAPRPAERQAAVAADIDGALPTANVLTELVSDPVAMPGEEVEPAAHPLLETSWLEATMTALLKDYGSTFGAEWRADPARLLAGAVRLLAVHRLVEPVDGGVLALPLLGRYRNTVFTVRKREPAPDLFALEGAG